MINWLGLIFNSIWILGAALALAVLSITYYQSQQEEGKFRKLLNPTYYSVLLRTSGLMFCVGMILISSKWWESLLWLVLLGLCLFRVWEMNRG